MSCQNVNKFLPKTFLPSFYLKCSKNRKFTRNLNFKNFKRSSFGEYIHVTFLS